MASEASEDAAKEMIFMGEVLRAFDCVRTNGYVMHVDDVT
ncbi:hypothetical protein TcasGA2_TC009247 [Tribolium castaneum]|uniref:Uncharacterized protein n=1 Tax=Tribolium castaneum TaxID=7070 RepID=D6WSG4_TRICA|nr:hypothetical protein TcasGA2_TC009247 [Tribolium castaneum]